MPEVERYGVEPVPAEERTVGWRDLFAINFTFFLNPVMYVLGALAVIEGGLPLVWAIAAMVLGQALAFAALVIVARPGVDDGLPGQVAMRATFGLLGARGLTSPYRVIAATYWFAAQALTAAFGIQAIVVAMGGGQPPLVPTSLAVAVVQGALAVLGFDVMRWLLRVVLPLSVVSAGVIVGLYLDDGRPGLRPRPRRPRPGPAGDLGRLRDLRHHHVRLVADARHQRGRPLPLQPDAGGHADRARLARRSSRPS